MFKSDHLQWTLACPAFKEGQNVTRWAIIYNKYRFIVQLVQGCLIKQTLTENLTGKSSQGRSV